jgi:hypothetical protein
VRPGIQAYADAAAGLLRSPDRLAALAAGSRADATRYSVEVMSERFADGIERLLRTFHGKPAISRQSRRGSPHASRRAAV